MKNIKQWWKEKQEQKALVKLYKEERKDEKKHQSVEPSYTSEILLNAKLKKYQTREIPLHDESVTNTLVIEASNREINKLKRSNNHPRKKDGGEKLINHDGYLIELSNVSKDYSSGGNKITKVLHKVDLKIKPGEFVLLYGKSGSGKSTLLNIISGLDRPTSGDVVVCNKNLPYLNSFELTKFRRDNLSFIFQQYHLLNNITGYENVETGQILQKDKNHQINLVALFKEFDLLDVMNKYPSQMSGGQQQRISILRALAKNADIIFADEPTGALDKKTSTIIMETLKKINREQGKTIIMVSHDPDIVQYAQRKIVLQKGKIVSDTLIE